MGVSVRGIGVSDYGGTRAKVNLSPFRGMSRGHSKVRVGGNSRVRGEWFNYGGISRGLVNHRYFQSGFFFFFLERLG